MTFTKSTNSVAPADFDGINCLILGVKRQAGSGWIYQIATPTFPELTAAWSTDYVDKPDLIGRLGHPSMLGYLPIITEFRTDISLDSRFRAAVIRSRDQYAITRDSVLAPGVNLQPGDTIQMPLSMESALQGMLQEQDMEEERFLVDPELGF